MAKPGGLLFLVAAGALSRSAGVAIEALAPHARAGDGLGALLTGTARSLAVWVARYWGPRSRCCLSAAGACRRSVVGLAGSRVGLALR